MPHTYQRLFADLRRRNVFKVASVYGATGFVVLQVADLLASSMELPPVVMRVTTFATLMGFPIALVLAWALESSPEGMKRTAPAATGELEAIIAEPGSRRWLAGILAIGGVLALTAGAWWVGRASAPSIGTPVPAASALPAGSEEVLRIAYADLGQDPRPTIAVLPFVDLSESKDQAYFTDGMTEEILNALAKIRGLRVTGRTSSFAYRGEERDLRQIGAELGVQYLIEGSLRQQGAQRRITAQLIDATGDFHLWSETYDYSVDDVFRIQSEIAQAVAGELQVSLGLGAGGQLVTPTSDLEAYDLFLLGRSKMAERGDGVTEAIGLFSRATALDPGWAPAWAGLAMAQSLLPYWPARGTPWPDSAAWASALDAGEASARRALDLDPRNPAAEVALGNVFRDRWDWDQSEVHYLRALSIAPDDSEAHQQYADLLGAIGRTPESVRSARRAVELDPTAVSRLNSLCLMLVTERELVEAREVCEKAVAQAPAHWNADYHLAGIHLALGDVEGAVEVHRAAFRRLDPPWDESLIDTFGAAWTARDTAVLETLAWPLMWVDEWRLIGDTTRALQMLERGFRRMPHRADEPHNLWRILPLAEAQRDPRFAYSLERLGLAR